MLVWSSGYVSDETLNRIHNLIQHGEDVISHFYLDTNSLVTIGPGIMCPTAESAAKLNLINQKTGKVATEEEKKAAWQKIRDISPPHAKINYLALHYAKFTDVRMTDEEAASILDKHLEGDYSSLRNNFDGFDSFPETAKIALFDIIYNVGSGGFSHFHNLIQSCKMRDWKKASTECHRQGPSADRNAEIKNLFLVAANEQEPVTQNTTAPTTVPNAIPKKENVVPQHHDAPPYHCRAPRHHRALTTNIIKTGNKGENVRTLQRALNRYLSGVFKVHVDGTFGHATFSAVRMAQTRAKLPADGIVGFNTMKILDIFQKS